MKRRLGEKILFIVTGGTIDSVWDGSKDTVVVSKHSVLPDYFANLKRNLKLYEDIIFKEVCMKDSRMITNDDRKEILKTIEDHKAKKIIVTHGTYTMPDTARYLEGNIKRKDQTIVITGSMVPVKGFDYSDGPFNLGYAISQVQTLAPGVYVCMNATVFTPQDVAKNVAEGKFYSIFQEKQ